MTQTAHDSPPIAQGATRCPDCTDGLGKPRPVKPGSLRERVHSTPSLLLPWRIGVFVLGLLFVLLGIALTALPGPLTIPPVLVGLWIWSTEFQWAARFFATFTRKAQDAWRHEAAPRQLGGRHSRRPGRGGVAFWAVGHYRLVDEAKVALGL
jgi:hypothetical protein